MRIAGIELSGFRGFPHPQRLDLDADVVILSGANGQGKTSVFDGVLWAITGRITRLGDDDKNVVSLYSESGEAWVKLELRTDRGEHCRVVRRFDGERQHLRLEFNGDTFRDSGATARLLELLWPEALINSDGMESLTRVITRSVYLQQDLVRQFVEADTDQERFNAVSELIGAGRVTEFQVQLDRAKTAWTRATNIRDREVEEIRRRLAGLERQLEALSRQTERPEDAVPGIWDEWWRKAAQFGVKVQHFPPPESLEAARALDLAIKQLESLRQAAHRRRDLAFELLSQIIERSRMTAPNEESLQQEVETTQEEVHSIRQALAEAETRAAEARHALVRLRETREELRALAQLALRHLEDLCPVCAQPYDQIETRRRLEDLISAEAEEGDRPPIAEEVATIAAALEEKERALLTAQAQLGLAREASRQWQAWLADRDRRLRELGVDPKLGFGATERLGELVTELEEFTTALSAHREEAESLALTLARAAERARRAELEDETAAVRRELEDLNQLLESRRQTGELAAQILDGLREAASDVVRVKLKSIEPLLQRIYSRVDPHPAFRVVKFLTRFWHGRGRLYTEINDPIQELSTEWPSVVLSSSQINALAVAVFLAFNLSVPRPPLSAVILDDPLQSLDDVNLLGLIDLLRRTKDQRQLLVSAHDIRFARLLERKLRPVQGGQRASVIEFEGWTRQGPLVGQRDIVPDATPLRIVA